MAKKLLYAARFTGNRFPCLSIFLLTLFAAFVIGESAVYSQCAILPPAPPTALTISTGAAPTSTPISGGSGLVAQWKFDEGSGTIACDSSGNGNNGTLANGPLWTAGKIGNALYFDGVNDNVVVAASNSLDLTGSFTLSAWVNPATAFTDFRSILVKNYKYYLYASVAGYCGNGSPLGGFGEGTGTNVCQPSPLPINTWTHLALTYNGSTVMLYRNGVAVATSSFSGMLSPTTGTLQIGASQYGEYFQGLIDEVRIYSRALSVAEIQAMYQEAAGVPSQSVATPVISPSGGSYSGSVSVTMQTSTPGASIYYTTDGSTPTQSSFLYNGALNLTSNTTVKATGFAGGYNPSVVAAASFTNTGTSTGTGKIYYVATTGSDSNPGTLANPFRTIRKGIGLLRAGDTLYIRGGTYPERIGQDFFAAAGTSWNNAITIAAYGGDTVILQPTTYAGVIVLNGESNLNLDLKYVIFDGLIFDGTNLGDNNLGFLYKVSYIRFVNCEIRNAPFRRTGMQVVADHNEFINTSVHDNGGDIEPQGLYANYAFYIEGSYNLFDGLDVYNNGSYGFHIYHTGGGVTGNIVRNSRVHDNGYGHNFSAGILLSSGSNNQVYNNIVYNNYGGIQVGSSNIVYNNTVYGNVTWGINIQGNDSQVKNNISFANPNGNIINTGNGTVLSNNLTTDPSFVNASVGDFHLQSGSAAIDRGADLSAFGILTDFEGAARPKGCCFDIGAYEY